MTATLPNLERTIHTANHWLEELSSELGRDDTQHAYRVLRAVLFALRDRLTVDEATDLGAQLPLLVRGIYYEGWNPSKNPNRQRNREQFLQHVAQYMQLPVDGAPEDAARAVFGLLEKHITAGEIDHVKSNLPADVRTLWP